MSCVTGGMAAARASMLRAPLVGSRQRSRENSAGATTPLGICQHAEGDDARNLLRLREIDRQIFGDFAGVQRHDADVRLPDRRSSG